jgi:hypothetical protein
MLKTIAYYLILGKPLIMYLGILTLLSFLTTAYIGMNVLKPKKGIPFKYHLLFVRISFTLAIIHAALGLSLYF